MSPIFLGAALFCQDGPITGARSVPEWVFFGLLGRFVFIFVAFWNRFDVEGRSAASNCVAQWQPRRRSLFFKPICLSTDTGPYARMRHGDHDLAEIGPDSESLSLSYHWYSLTFISCNYS